MIGARAAAPSSRSGPEQQPGAANAARGPSKLARGQNSAARGQNAAARGQKLLLGARAAFAAPGRCSGLPTFPPVSQNTPSARDRHSRVRRAPRRPFRRINFGLGHWGCFEIGEKNAARGRCSGPSSKSLMGNSLLRAAARGPIYCSGLLLGPRSVLLIDPEQGSLSC